MSGQDVLGFLWVDVDPAGDDHVTLPVGQIQVPVRVDVADIPYSAGRAVAGAALGGFHRILEVLERGRAAEPDGPVHPRRAPLSPAVEDEEFSQDGTADGAGVRGPFGGVA